MVVRCCAIAVRAVYKYISISNILDLSHENTITAKKSEQYKRAV